MKNRFIRLSKALQYETTKRLPWIIAILILLSATAFWQSYSKTAEGVQIAKQNTRDIKNLISSQTDLLSAIKQVTVDNTMTAKQQTDVIICMLQVPLSRRTADIKESCRKQVEVTESTSQGSDSSVPGSGETPQINHPSSNNTPQIQNPQPESSHTYTECISDKSGLLDMIKGVLVCL